MTLRTLTDRSASDSFEERAFVTIYLPALSAFATLRNHAKSLTASVSTVTVIIAGQKRRKMQAAVCRRSSRASLAHFLSFAAHTSHDYDYVRLESVAN
jgi:hypothetical protein